ncbi:hypothetical protein EUTSA_v10026050mg [Eutrema salsugineum]|uniref:SHSP domain-containing protein n=1 Tax=Eutrema salsugineum TaxID=72664 RepID=V4P840_EUTSA|nr:hypothetical protein EUTSA_v10026050mg [Eutrema salsugineum]
MSWVYGVDHDGAEGYYATNNEFLVSGSKGFTEMKMLENEESFLRIDLPGVPKEGLTVSLDPSKRFVLVTGEAPKFQHDSSDRKYGIFPGITCDCCELSGFTTDLRDGVLRLILSKINHMPQRTLLLLLLYLRSKGPHKFPHGSDPNDPVYTGPVLESHPCVFQGSGLAYESKQLQNGSLYVRVDMPGHPKERFTVSVAYGRVSVTGEAPVVSHHDQGARFYSGDVAMLSTPVDIPSHRIQTIAKDGVLRLIIPSV